MEWNQLHCFLVAAQEENLSRAAQTLHISQPSLSQTIKRLEEERLRHEEAERKIREAAEREAKNAAKREQLTDIITSTLHFCAEFYPSFGITTEEVDSMSDETVNALAELFLMMLDMEAAKKTPNPLRATMKLGPMTFPCRAPKATLERGLRSTSNTMDEVDTKPSNDDIFASFFKNFM